METFSSITSLCQKETYTIGIIHSGELGKFPRFAKLGCGGFFVEVLGFLCMFYLTKVPGEKKECI